MQSIRLPNKHPRMLLCHPKAAFYHLKIDGRRAKPGRAARKTRPA